jgi:hypothetical protein
MRSATILLIVLCATGCGGQGGCNDTLVLTSDMDTCFAVEYQAIHLETAESEDTTVDWSGLTTDLFGRDIDPQVDVARIWSIRMHDMTYEDLLFETNCRSIDQADISWIAEYLPDGDETSALMSDFDGFGWEVDVEAVFHTDVFAFTAVGETSDQILMQAIVTPTAGADVETIRIAEDVASLVLHTETAGETIPSIQGPTLWVDWSAWADSAGGDSCGICPGSGSGDGPPPIELLRLARYDASVSHPQLDMIASEALAAEVVYEATVDDEVVLELTALETEDGDTFSGFDGGGIWMLGLLGDFGLHWRPYFLGEVGD